MELVKQILIAEVAIPAPLRHPFSYRVPERLSGAIAPGARVRVPFGPRRVVGVCVGLRGEPPPDRALADLKEIESVLDREPALGPALLELTRFVATYYRCSWGEALQGALPGSVKRRLRRSPSPLPPPPLHSPLAPLPSPSLTLTLTDGQRRALDAILDLVRARAFGVTLVHGVTGSGKTEVYLRAIEEALHAGRSAILLVPEIALTPQTVARIRARFGDAGILHSMQGDAERARQWERIRSGAARVVVGPRSAVFAPVQDLGLIVVDEEHDPSFKQESVPRYHARDVAVARARIEGAVAVLGSATPSLETYVNAREGRYRGVYLAERASGADLPRVEVVDLGEESKEVKGFPFISRRLEQALRGALGRGEQAILFLNRRGFATFLRCRRCKHVLECVDCSAALTFHKVERVAACHYCDARRPPPAECPRCLAHEIQYFGFGTERVEEEVLRRFPAARVRRVDSDSIEDARDLEAALAAFGRGETQVLIGTQMVAKGLDFPRVTVVGVINADTALNFPDFRAAERTFQLVAQVAGRSGRGGPGPGDVPGADAVSIVQTFAPRHPVIDFARRHDTLGFLESEIEHRRKLGYPPFGRLAKALVSGPVEEEAARAAETVAAAMRAAADAAPGGAGPALVLGPAPAPLAVLRKRYRFMILVKSKDRAALKPPLEAAERMTRLPSRVRVAIDVDPASML